MAVNAYYLAIDGKTHGPYRPQQVRARLNQRKVTESDFIWREGFDDWKRISDVMEEIPGDEAPPAPAPDRIRTLEITHPNELPATKLEIPEKGVYEPPATLKQKNLLMKCGCRNPEVLRSLGRDQASFMIDAFQKDKDAVVQYELAKLVAAKRQGQTKRIIMIATVIAGAIVLLLLLAFLAR